VNVKDVSILSTCLALSSLDLSGSGCAEKKKKGGEEEEEEEEKEHPSHVSGPRNQQLLGSVEVDDGNTRSWTWQTDSLLDTVEDSTDAPHWHEASAARYEPALAQLRCLQWGGAEYRQQLLCALAAGC
jgi:hypothetical protein